MINNNLISVEFTDQELQEIDLHLTALEAVIENKCKSLTPDERMIYSRLGNRTENWSKKVVDYMRSQPSFTPTFVDVEETNRDYSARQVLKQRFNRLNVINDMVDDTLLMLGSDIYHSCVSYYRNVKMQADQNVNGAKTIYDDLSAQFPGRPSQAKPAETKE